VARQGGRLPGEHAGRGARSVDGWVRNLDDGRVETVFEGAEAAVERLVDCYETGTPRADVREVSLEWETEGIEGVRGRW